MHTVEKVMQISSEEKHPNLNGKIYENKFGYHTKSEVYANKSSDIKELYDIPPRSLEMNKKNLNKNNINRWENDQK